MRNVDATFQYDQDSLKIPDYRVAQYILAVAQKIRSDFLNKPMPHVHNAVLESLQIKQFTTPFIVEIFAKIRLPTQGGHAMRKQGQNGLYLSDVVLATMIDELITTKVSHFPWQCFVRNNAIIAHLITQESGNRPGVTVQIQME